MSISGIIPGKLHGRRRYAWTTQRGETVLLSSGGLATIAMPTSTQRPIELVLPAIRKILGMQVLVLCGTALAGMTCFSWGMAKDGRGRRHDQIQPEPRKESSMRKENQSATTVITYELSSQDLDIVTGCGSATSAGIEQVLVKGSTPLRRTQTSNEVETRL